MGCLADWIQKMAIKSGQVLKKGMALVIGQNEIGLPYCLNTENGYEIWKIISLILYKHYS